MSGRETVFIGFGVSTQDVLSDLGEPDSTSNKVVKVEISSPGRGGGSSAKKSSVITDDGDPRLQTPTPAGRATGGSDSKGTD